MTPISVCGKCWSTVTARSPVIIVAQTNADIPAAATRSLPAERGDEYSESADAGMPSCHDVK
jgi:hypothetical protein